MEQRVDFRDQISRNKRNSFFLVVFIFVLIIVLGYFISYTFEPGYFFVIMAVSIVISIGYTLFGYYLSDKVALISVGAREAERAKYKFYYDLVEGLTFASGLPMPRLYIMPSSQINAFASGRNPENAVVCITEGALNKLEKRELEGVLAHELGHIGNYDIRYMTLVAVMVGMIAIVSELFLRSLWMKNRDNRENKGAILVLIGIILAVLAPIVVQLVQLAISRKREYTADATAVKFTRYPTGLTRALKKIKIDYSTSSGRSEHISKALAPMFFASPFSDLVSTHPAIDKRIEILERM